MRRLQGKLSLAAICVIRNESTKSLTTSPAPPQWRRPYPLPPAGARRPWLHDGYWWHTSHSMEMEYAIDPWAWLVAMVALGARS
jgi:hypothetical protein